VSWGDQGERYGGLGPPRRGGARSATLRAGRRGRGAVKPPGPGAPPSGPVPGPRPRQPTGTGAGTVRGARVGIRRGWGVGAGASPDAAVARGDRVRNPPGGARRPTTAASGAPPRRWAGGPHRHARGIKGHGTPTTQDATMPRSFANTDGMAVAPGSSGYWDGSVRRVYREGGPTGPSRAPHGPWMGAARRAQPPGSPPSLTGPHPSPGGHGPRPWEARRGEGVPPAGGPREGTAGGGGGARGWSLAPGAGVRPSSGLPLSPARGCARAGRGGPAAAGLSRRGRCGRGRCAPPAAQKGSPMPPTSTETPLTGG